MEDKEYTIDQLRQLVLEIYGLKVLTPTIDNQIRQNRISGISYKEMGRAIYYYSEVLNKKISEVDLRKYGIHNPLAYVNEANKYFQNLERLEKQRPKTDEQELVEVRYYKPTTYKPKDETIDLDKL